MEIIEISEHICLRSSSNSHSCRRRWWSKEIRRIIQIHIYIIIIIVVYVHDIVEIDEVEVSECVFRW